MKFSIARVGGFSVVSVLEAMGSSGICIGRVTDQEFVIFGEASPQIEYREVRILQLPDIEHRERITIPSRFSEIIEVFTRSYGISFRWCRFKVASGVYEEKNPNLLTFDICGGDLAAFRTVESEDVISYMSNYYDRIGDVICGDQRLALGNPSIYNRFLEKRGSEWKVVTLPYIGDPFEEFFVPVLDSNGPYRTRDLRSKTLNLANPLESNLVLFFCGTCCMFFDGCIRSDFRIVNVVNGDNIIFIGENVRCLVAKLETFDNERHLTIHTKFLLGDKSGVNIFVSEGGRPFVEAVQESITLDLIFYNQDERLSVLTTATSIEIFLHQKYRAKYVISEILYNGRIFVSKNFEDNEVVSRRIFMDRGIVVTVDSEYKYGPKKRSIYTVNRGRCILYDPFPTTLDFLFTFRSNEDFIVSDTSPGIKKVTIANKLNKIGKILFDGQIIRHDRAIVRSTECSYNGNHLFLMNTFHNGAKYRQRYRMRNGPHGNPKRTFIEQCKVLIHVQLTSIKEIIRSSQCLIVDKLGKLLRIKVRDEYVHLIGSVLFGSYMIISHDSEASSRAIYLDSEYMLQLVVVRTCSIDGDCYSQCFERNVTDTGVIYITRPKRVVNIDIWDGSVIPSQIKRSTAVRGILAFRVKDEFAFTHRIGSVSFKGILLFSNCDDLDERMVDYHFPLEGADQSFARLRLLDISPNLRSSKLYDLRVPEQEDDDDEPRIEVQRTEKIPIDLDVNPLGYRDPVINLLECDGTYIFHVPWTRSLDYVLKRIFYRNLGRAGNREVLLLSSESEGESLRIVPTVSVRTDENASQSSVLIITEDPNYQQSSRVVLFKISSSGIVHIVNGPDASSVEARSGCACPSTESPGSADDLRIPSTSSSQKS